MRKSRKLSLNKETLSQMESQKDSGTLIGNDSCVDSCFFVSCGGGCTISTGLKG
jgi:hypothetical protein